MREFITEYVILLKRRHPMSNFLDYITWRGDLSLRQDHFNTIDSLILSRFIYLPLDDIVTDTPITIAKAYKQYIELNRHKSPAVITELDNVLFEKMASSKRFKHLTLQHFTNLLNEEKEIQFCAMLVHLDDQTTYIAFRGTDNSLFGWKEDFNMTFQTTIPSQNLARAFVLSHFNDLKESVLFGGHSKGGNLAIYSAIFAHDIDTKRIKAIYNFDGPGFNPELKLNGRYHLLKPSIKTFIPKTAIVGVFMNYMPSYKIVTTNAKVFAQHDTYSWLVEGCQLIYASRRTKKSKRIETVLQHVLKDYTPEDLETIINTFYNLLIFANIKDVRDFNNETPQKLLAILKGYRALDKSSSTLVQKFIQTFIGLLLTGKKD